MTAKLRSLIVPRRLIGPGGFLWAALGLCLLYFICHLMGWREYTAFLSGSAPPGEQGTHGLLLGVVYMAAYFGFVLVAPVLVLASGIFALLLRPWRRG
jgi:hypothetical protein